MNVAYLEVKELNYGLISWMKGINERFTVAKSVFLLVDVRGMGCEGRAAHSADIHQS
jgi:hypothetical protein